MPIVMPSLHARHMVRPRVRAIVRPAACSACRTAVDEKSLPKSSAPAHKGPTGDTEQRCYAICDCLVLWEGLGRSVASRDACPSALKCQPSGGSDSDYIPRLGYAFAIWFAENAQCRLRRSALTTNTTSGKVASS